jgi:hypothetical protein
MLICLPNLFLRVIEIPRCSSVTELSDQYFTHPTTASVRSEIVVAIVINIDVSGVSESLKNPSSPVCRQCWWGFKFLFGRCKQIGPS